MMKGQRLVKLTGARLFIDLAALPAADSVLARLYFGPGSEVPVNAMFIAGETAVCLEVRVPRRPHR
jgi:hypothetical protein